MLSLGDCQTLIDDALSSVRKALDRVNRGNTKQIAKIDDLDYFKALTSVWFGTVKPKLMNFNSEIDLKEVDDAFICIYDATAKHASRNTYKVALKAALKNLIIKRSEVVIISTSNMGSVEQPPDFSIMVGDSTMLNILQERWSECSKCLDAGAYLAATVMMGGLLEASFVARVNILDDKIVLFKCKSTPTDKKTNKPLLLKKWTLGSYINVSHEMGWISKSAKDIAVVLRNYRNYVHPEKQWLETVTIGARDAEILWDVTKRLIYQILGSIK